MRQFTLPDLGEGLEEAEIVSWHVNEGDHVVADQPLVSVETDKAVVEVPSPWSGRIAHLFGGKGDLIKVGTPLVEFAESAGEDTGTVVGELGREEVKGAAAQRAAEPTPARTIAVLPAVRALARKLDVDLNLVQASGPGGTITRASGGSSAASISALPLISRAGSSSRCCAISASARPMTCAPASIACAQTPRRARSRPRSCAVPPSRCRILA
jgi:2-oxoisovalerate dehydrogenase E2 component (dihydrolipoyl transacylase)